MLVVLVLSVMAGLGGLAILLGLNTRLSLKVERTMRHWLRQRASARDERQSRDEIVQQVASIGSFNLRMRCRDRILKRQPQRVER